MIMPVGGLVAALGDCLGGPVCCLPKTESAQELLASAIFWGSKVMAIGVNLALGLGVRVGMVLVLGF